MASPSTRLLSALLGLAAVASASSFSLQDETSPTRLDTTGRFFFTQSCQTVKNEDTGKDERCCSGNFRCKESVCKGKSPCNSFIGSFLWCRGRKCEATSNPPRSSTRSPSPSPTPEVLFEEDPEESPEVFESPEEEIIFTPSPSPSAFVPSPSSSPVPSSSTSPTAKPSTSTTPSTSPSMSPAPSQSGSPIPSPSSASRPRTPTNPLNCEGQRMRKEIRDLTPAELRRWQRAVEAMMVQPNGQWSQWETLVNKHMQFGDEAHGGCYFLPWHRLFLLELENLMREHEPDFTLPYWDWTRDSINPAISEIWGVSLLGGARRVNQPIPNGPFANIISRAPSYHTVSRNFDAGVSGSMNQLWSWPTLERLIAEPWWGDFADGIESAHVLPHMEIGGDMISTFHAPNDPIFYLHHAYIDFLFRLRQDRNGRYDFGGTHDFSWGQAGCSLDATTRAFNVPYRTAFDMTCVNYVIANNQGVNNGIAGRTNAWNVARALNCSDEAFLKNSGLSKARCEKGTSKLTSGN